MHGSIEMDLFAEYSFSESMQSNWHVTNSEEYPCIQSTTQKLLLTPVRSGSRNSEAWLPSCLPYDLSSLHLRGDP